MPETPTPSEEPVNPYAPTTEIPLEPVASELSEPEAIRKKYISHEMSIRSIGSLYIIGGLFTLLGFGDIFLSRAPIQYSVVIKLGAWATFLFVVATGLTLLRLWARWLGLASSVLLLAIIPIGTIVGVYSIIVLSSPKSTFVFSPTYAAIRAKTPHVKYKTPTYLWVILALFVLTLLLLVFGFAR